MDEMLPPPSPQEQEKRLHEEHASRRTFLMRIGIALNAAVVLAIATPVVGYLLGPVLRKKEYHQWVEVGNVASFQSGETTLIQYQNPFTDPWDGETARVLAYVRRSSVGEFTVFAINCAHLGCPVRWFSESQLFMCPCHGGIYYADGSRAAGPPQRGLFTYDYRIESGKLLINAGQLPTLSNQASMARCVKEPLASSTKESALVTRIAPCPGTNTSTIG